MSGVRPEVRLVPHVVATRSGSRRYLAEWGRLRVPTVRANPDLGELDLAFVRVCGGPRPTREGTHPTTIVLSGGPGLSAIENYLVNDAAADQVDALAAAGDVVFLDQRGTGASRPCLQAPVRWQLPLERAIDAADVADEGVARVGEAADLWTRRGVELSGFNTEESADDVDAVRRALGLERVNLFGVSYGSHLALSVLRRHGDHIGRAVLASVEGPDHTDKLPGVVHAGFERFASAVGAARPDAGHALVERAATALAALRSEPRAVDVTGDVDADPRRVVIGEHDLAVALAESLGFRAPMTRVLGWIEALEAGDADWLAARAAQWRRRWLEPLTYWYVDAASGASSARRDRIQWEGEQTVLGAVADHPLAEVRARCRLPVLDAEFRSDLRSAVPTLFVSGTLDVRTPPANADEVRQGFERHEHLVVENGAHGRDLFVPEVCAATTAFLRTGESGAPAHLEAPPIMPPADSPAARRGRR